MPIPLPAPFNSELERLDTLCHAQIFFKDKNSDELTFLSSIETSWNIFYVSISNLLAEKELPRFNVKVGIVKETTASNIPIIPVLSPAESFFTTKFSYKNGQKIMIIVVTADDLRKLFLISPCINYILVVLKIDNHDYPIFHLPTIPRRIAQISALQLREADPQAETSRFLRRLLTTSINGGVIVDLVDAVDLKFDDFQLKSSNFSKQLLHLNNCEISDLEILNLLDLPIGNLKNYLNNSSNEASIVSLFWTIVLNKLFRSGENRAVASNHKMAHEWKTDNIYGNKSITSRDVDLVVLIEFASTESISNSISSKKMKFDSVFSIPILTVETSRYDFEVKHKDFGKIAGLISANCITMAHHLIKMGKNPEEARAYGILIGGYHVQLCTAHAVSTKVSANAYEIHANLTFNDHWFMPDTPLFDPPCQEPCCSRTLIPGLESIKPPSHVIDFTKLKISCPDDIVVLVSADEIVPSLSEIKINSVDFSDPVNIVYLKRLKAFVDCIKNRINFLKSDECKDNTGRQYTDPEGQFYFSQANQGITMTPQKGIPIESHNNRHIVMKPSQSELSIYSQCFAYFPTNFPKIYDIEICEDGQPIYTFEKLVPFSKYFMEAVKRNHSLAPFLKFGIECLFGLHLLHEKVGIIHCDISPVNIMYSEEDEVFKILDFDLSMTISQAQQNTFPGIGTKNFIAPEGMNSGIYNASSDVYSLGMVIFLTMLPLLYQLDIEEEETTQYVRVVAGMIYEDPVKRLSVMGALKEFFMLLDSLGNVSIGSRHEPRCRLLLSAGEIYTELTDNIMHLPKTEPTDNVKHE